MEFVYFLLFIVATYFVSVIISYIMFSIGVCLDSECTDQSDVMGFLGWMSLIPFFNIIVGSGFLGIEVIWYICESSTPYKHHISNIFGNNIILTLIRRFFNKE